jgi:RNA polymerase sigma-70 factor (ECF subfamily)
MTALERTNAAWLRELRETGARGAHAQQDLRELVVRALRRGLGSRPEASASIEDFAQESVVRILEQLDSFRDESRFSTWAIAIAMRVSFSALRRRHWRDISIEALVAEPPAEARQPGFSEQAEQAGVSPERAVARREILAVLERCTEESLTERQRQIVLAELRGMPQVEIAAQLGSNLNALHKLGHDARRALQRALLAAGYSAEAIRWAFE